MRYNLSNHSGSLLGSNEYPILESIIGRRSKGNLKDIPESYLELIPESVARQHTVLPLGHEGETTVVAGCQEDIQFLDKLRFLLNSNIRVIRFSRNEIKKAIDLLYGSIEGGSRDSIHQKSANTMIDYCETIDLAESAGHRERNSNFQAEFGKLRSSKQVEFQPQSAPRRSVDKEKSVVGSEGMFYYTVNEGNQVLAYKYNGRIEKIVGPARVWKGFSRFREMKHHVAHPGAFMVVHFKDGRQENIPGPAEIWLDPRIHSSITVQDGLPLAAKEAVVVYGKNEEGETNRRLCFGPSMFVPKPGEWLHEFSWHASRGGSKGVDKKPHGLKFQKLWLMPDQMYHDVKDVRTADDAVLVIRLMIFFELLDIEKMLDTTHDPIGDFVNAATSDVVEFTGKRTFAEFKQQTDQLNDLDTYAQLIHRAEQCGYRINNVVYRGYGAPESLQRMHDEAIQARTRLQLEKATETQTQELEDYRLQCQVERAQKRRQEQTTEVEHDLLIQQKQEDSKIEARQKQEEFARLHKRRLAEQEIEILDKQQQSQRSHFEQLRTMGVDLTQYLTQGRADQVIELRGDGGRQPHLHLSQNGTKKPK